MSAAISTQNPNEPFSTETVVISAREAVSASALPPAEQQLAQQLQPSNSAATGAPREAAPAGANDRQSSTPDSTLAPHIPQNDSFFAKYSGPEHLRGLAYKIHQLDDNELAHIAEYTQKKADTQLYSVLQYSGEAWYLPKISPVEEGQPRWGISFSGLGVLHITVNGQRMDINLLSYAVRAVLVIVFWFALYNIFPNSRVWLSGDIFDPLLLIAVSSIVGGIVCRFLQIPPLIGVLWIGIMWANIPRGQEGFLTSGIGKATTKVAQQHGLTIVLMRAGFSISWKNVRPIWWQMLLFSLVPVALDCCVHSLVAWKVFDYPDTTWAFLHGFANGSTSPAVVVPAILFISSKGCSTKFGPLMTTSVGLDAASAIWAINFILGLVSSDTPLGLAIASGPLQIVIGLLLGAVVGLILYFCLQLMLREADKLVTGRYSTTHRERVSLFYFLLVVCAAHCFIFYGYSVNLAGGGSMAVLGLCAASAHMLLRDPKNEEDKEQKMMMSSKLIDLWDLWSMPVLFSHVGASMVLSKVFNSFFFPRALLCIFCGSTARFVAAFGILHLLPGLALGDRFAGALGWIGRATVQAAAGGAPYNVFAVKYAADPGKYAHEYEMAEQIKNSAILSIIVGAPLASLVLVKLAPRLASK